MSDDLWWRSTQSIYFFHWIPFNCFLSITAGIPVLTVGIRRYTNEENRGFAFGLFYVIMNV